MPREPVIASSEPCRLSRRQFVGALGTAALMPPPGASPSGVAISRQTTSPTSDIAALFFLSTVALADLIRQERVSARDVVQACLTRIAEVNPALNAIVQDRAELALDEAAARDAQAARNEPLGPLHGVPMTIKDSFDTAGVVSTGGTLGRKAYIPERDATVVARLRSAGAILLGKTNTTELTLESGGKGTHNLIYGETKNPYNLGYRPSSSSGGAAAIVAAGGSHLTRLAEQLDGHRSEMLRFMNDFDIILCPASPVVARPLDSERDRTIGTYMAVYNTTGWPAGVVRTGTSPDGLPLGIQVVGRPWADHVAVAVMAHSRHRPAVGSPPDLVSCLTNSVLTPRAVRRPAGQAQRARYREYVSEEQRRSSGCIAGRLSTNL